MIRTRYAIAIGIALTAAVSSAIALGANPTRGAGLPVGHSVQPKTTASAQRADKRNRSSAAQKQAERVAPDPPAATRFATVTIRIDPKGTPLAAYQFEVTAGHAFTVVGLDNAGNPSFPDAPHYDRSTNADATDRLIVADYSTAGPGQLIAKPYPVATIHAAFTGPADDDNLDALRDSITLTLTAAADMDGNPIDAELSFDLHFAERPGTE